MSGARTVQPARRMRLLVLPCAITALVATAAADVEHRTSSVASTTDRFPGAFDAGSLDRGDTVLDVLPLPSVAYGVTDELSVQVGALHMLSWVDALPGFAVSARYRVYGHDRWASTVTFSGGLASLGVGDYDMRLKHASAVLTLERRANPRRSAALSLYAGGLVGDVQNRMDELNEARSTLGGVGLVLSHHHFPARWFGYQLAIAFVPWLDGQLTSPGNGTRFDATDITVPLGARLRMFVRPASRWLFSLGADILPPGFPIPYLGVQRSW